MKYKVIDTNIVLLDANNILNLASDGSVVVISETAMDELDDKKTGHDNINFEARRFGRLLAQATRVKHTSIPEKGMHISGYLIDNVNIEIVSVDEYPDYSHMPKSVQNDRRIIYVAELIESLGRETIFLSNDTMCRERASVQGLDVSDVRDVESIDFTFVKTLEVPIDVFISLHNHKIKDIDPEYEYQNFNYKFVCEDTSQTKLATINNEIIEVIGKDTEKKLREQDMPPVNAEQLFMSKHIQDPTVDIVVAESLAGSGKTLSALSNAIKLVNSNTPYTSIIYIRASVDDVDDVEAVGFLSGNDEKMAVYLHPLHDSLDAIVRKRLSKKKLKGRELDEAVMEGIETLISKCNIQGITTLGLRGRTFENCVIIWDEAQNQTKTSCRTTITRWGKNCKAIIIGSNRQIDNKYLSRYTNGLSVILDDCTEPNDFVKARAVTLTKVVRSPAAEWGERLYEKGNK